MTRRVGVTQRVEDLADRNERRDALDQAWIPLLRARGLLPVPVPNRLDDPVAWVDELGIDGFVLTGGNDLADAPGATATAPERDQTEYRLLETALDRGWPVLAVCRGLQLLVRQQGGLTVPVSGHVATRHTIEVTDADDLPLVDGRTVNSFHDFGIEPDDVHGDLVIAARAPDATVEAVRHSSLPVVGVMWHPERDPRDDADSRLIDLIFGGAP